MSDENDELGLSLALTHSSSSHFNNLMQQHNNSPDTTNLNLQRLFTSTDRINTTSFRRGFDVNQVSASAAGDYDDENGVSSPNSSTVSSQSGKRSKRGGEEERTTSCSIGGSDDEEGNGGGCGGVGDDMSSKKKLRLTKEQSLLLEDLFKDHNSLNTRQKQELAQRLSLSARQVEVWFQNRRARIKLKQTEVDCEQLKKCCENLTEENKRLQKEVQELRALKLSPQFYMQMNPPTTLTMCPSCQCVGVTPTGSSSSATATTASSKVLVTGHKGQPAIDRPVPISPWAALSIPHHRPVDEPAPTSRS